MTEKKIRSKEGLKRVIRLLKKKRKRIVFTNGCFDVIHFGHVKYLEDAREKGDTLIVGLNSDESVKKIKGPGRPVIGERDRARVIAALEAVDYVTLFNEKTPLELIKYLSPDILVKGGDWGKKDIVGRDFVKKVVTIPYVLGRSTSVIIDRIKKLT